MRVIAGSLGGRRLTAPTGRQSTRPTSDRVREALFAMLGNIDGARVLDLFAGTGALGIEALSRGAGRALFVERDRAALQALRANLDALALRPPLASVRAGDAFTALRDAQNGGETYDLVLVDPPYARAGELEGPLDELLPEVLSDNGGRVVVESDRRAVLKLALTSLRERRYGDTLIAIYGKMSAQGSGRVPDQSRPNEAGQGDEA